MSTIRCKKCKYEMNVATGTFGSGIPSKCPDCQRILDHEFVSDGWTARDSHYCPKCEKKLIRDEAECSQYHQTLYCPCNPKFRLSIG